MEDKVRLSLFGGPLLLPGPDVQPMTARRPLAIMAILAVHDPPRVPRELIAGIIWSDVEDRRARGSLRQTLSDLRNAHRSIARALVIERQTISLDKSHITTDFDDFMCAASEANVAKLESLSEHFEAQFLYGYEDLSAGFAEWLDQTRPRLRAMLFDRMQVALDRHDTQPSDQVPLARRILAIEPLDERACRVAMQGLAENGDLGQALQLYRKFYDQIGDELGMEPTAQTQDLAVAIKQGHFDTEATPAKPGAQLAKRRGLYGQPLLAVLPMSSFGPNLVPNDLPDMLVEDIICKIAGLPDLPVLSNATTYQLSGSIDQLGFLRDRYGVDYALKCTCRNFGGSYRITAQLLATDSGLVGWAQSFDAAEQELLSLQSQIAERVVRQLVTSVHSAELRTIEQFRPGDLGAYHLLLKARRQIFSLARDQFEAARGLLLSCIEAAPGFVQAQVALADWYSLCLGQRWSEDPAADRQAIHRLLAEALRLAPNNGRALAMLGHNAGIYDRDYCKADTSFARALEAMPNDAETLMWSAPVPAYVGDHDRAIRRGEKALALSPDDPLIFRYEHFLSVAHFAAGQFERAAQLGVASMDRNPLYSSNLRVTIGALVSLGRLAEARDIARRMLEADPDFRISDFVTWQAFQSADRRRAFGALLAQAGLPE